MATSLGLGNKISIYRGDDYVRTIRIDDDNADPIDITTWTFKFTAKPIAGYTDDTDDVEAIIAVAPVVTDGTAGEALLTISSETTNTITPDEYVYDIERDDGSGDIKTLVKGDFAILADVTRR